MEQERWKEMIWIPTSEHPQIVSDRQSGIDEIPNKIPVMAKSRIDRVSKCPSRACTGSRVTLRNKQPSRREHKPKADEFRKRQFMVWSSLPYSPAGV